MPAFHDVVRARLLAHVDERTPRFFKDGDGRYAVRAEPAPDGERWIRVERPDATVRYRLDACGRIEVVPSFLDTPGCGLYSNHVSVRPWREALVC